MHERNFICCKKLWKTVHVVYTYTCFSEARSVIPILTIVSCLICYIFFVVGTGPVSEDHECYLVDMCAVRANVDVEETCTIIWRY